MKKILALLLLLAAPALVSAEPLGIRTNNPGNLIKTTITWKGEVPCESRFECFSDAKWGIRAMALNLIGYQDRYGLYTIDDIIRRWSPPTENRTGLLIRAVSDRMGISYTEEIDLSNQKILVALIKAIIVQENGYNPYDDRIIEEITDGFTNSNGDNHNGGGDNPRRDYEIVGNEAGLQESATGDDDPETGYGDGGEGQHSEEYESTLPVDSEGNRINGGILCNIITEIGGSDRPRVDRHSWLDTMESRFLILLGKRGSYVEDCRGFCNNPPRHPRPQPDPWTLLWLQYSRPQVDEDMQIYTKC